MIERLEQWLAGLGLTAPVADFVAPASLAAGVVLLAWVADIVARRLLLRGIKRLVQRSETQWDDILLEEGVFRRVANFAPAIVVYSFGQAFGSAEPWIERLALRRRVVEPSCPPAAPGGARTRLAGGARR